jgi:uncharacterized protein YdeI (YjbR/CyaY-like superfamily)
VSSLATFASARAFRNWLARNHGTANELVVRCYKTHAGGRGITYAQAVEEALCFGWIDGVRRSVDAESFSVRFAPRRPKSIWSAVNIRKARELAAAGRMRPAGKAAFEARRERQSTPYSYESKPRALAPAAERRFKADRGAWAFFQAQASWYRRTSIFWVMEAKREETRARRLTTLIDCSAHGRRIPPLERSTGA